jgi:hypothetical protein
MDWNNLRDSEHDLTIENVAPGSDAQPPATFPVVRRGGPRDGQVMFWGRLPDSERQPKRALVDVDETFVQWDEDDDEG